MMRRWLKRHFYRRPRALPRWWRSPDRYLLRHETRWALHWLRRPAGIFWLIFPILYGSLIKIWGLFKWDGKILGYILLMLFVILFALWMWLVQTRTFAVYSDQRLQDLALSRFKQGHFWPGLLAAPVMIPMIVFSIFWIVFIMAPIMIEFAIKLMLFDWPTLFRSLHGAIPLLMLILVGVEVFSLCILFMVFIFQSIFAVSAHVSNRCSKNPSLMALLISTLGFGIRYYLRLIVLFLFLFGVSYLIHNSSFQINRQLARFISLAAFILAVCVFFRYLFREQSEALKDLRSTEFSELYRERLERMEQRDA